MSHMINDTEKSFQTKSNLSISQEVVSSIVKQAVLELPGVYALGACPITMKEWLYKNTVPKSIKIVYKQEVANIEISVVLNFGYNVLDTAEKIQTAVKDSVQNMTGVTVSKVDVFITSVHFQTEIKE